MEKEPSSRSVSSKSRSVRVFISSTFRDMQEERDILVKKVFPELRERCRERRIDFLGVDLRWGITEEQTERGETLPVCLEEIENCRPYFIGLLGERYGWVPDHVDSELIEMHPWLAEHREHSITALEILHGVLKNPDMADHSFFYFRDPVYLERVSEDLREGLEPENPESKKKLDALKERIRKSGVSVLENYPDPGALAGHVLYDLWTVIASQYPPVEEPDPLDREFADHEAFASNRLRIYIERAEYLERLDEHIKSTHPPLVLLGESGSGKSALIANWANAYRQKNPSHFLLVHFIGSTPESTDYTRILQRVMGELKRRYDLSGEIPTEPAQLCAEFPNWVSMASAKEGFVLILDGLNQLSERDNAPELGWLPEYFPPNVRVILSTLPGPSFEAVERRNYPMFRVEPLRDDERKRLIDDYLWQYRKRLSKERVNRIVGANQSENPLYLRVLLDELKVFGIHEKLDDRISHYLEAGGIDDLFQKVLARLEEDYESERPGLVGEAMSLLWASRRGLSENEMLSLLNVPQAVWSPFYLAIKDFLVTRLGLLGFFHDYLRKAVKERYLSKVKDRKMFHRRLADYFESSGEEERKVEEFPWNLCQAGDFERLEGALSDLELSRAIWEKSEFDLLRYWAFLEEKEFKKERTYQRVVQDPLNHQSHLSWVSELFYRTGVLDDSLKIREAWAELFRKSGDMNSLQSSFNDQALIHRDRGNLKEAMRLHKEQEWICRKLGNKDGLSLSLFNQALIHRDRGNLEEAMGLHKEEEHIHRELGSKDGFQASLGGQASIHNDRGNLEEAMRLYKEKERICRELGNKDGIQVSINGQAVIHYARGELDKAMRLYKEKERICRELGNKDGIQVSLNNQAVIHYARGELDKAMRLYKEKERICRELGNKDGIQVSLNGQAVILKDRGELEEATRLHKEAERICRELGNKRGLGDSLTNQAVIFKSCGEIDKAIRLHKEAECIYRELGDNRGVGGSLGNQAVTLRISGEPDEAMRLHKKEEHIYREMGDKRGLSISLVNQAVILKNRGDLDEAMRLNKETERICRELGNKQGLAVSLGNQANIHYARGDLNEAMRLHKKGEHIYREMGDKEGLAISLANQGELLAEKMGKFEEALPLVENAYLIASENGLVNLGQQIKPIIDSIQSRLDRLDNEIE